MERDVIYREAGFAPPAGSGVPREDQSIPDPGRSPHDAVRDALRNLRLRTNSAGSDLARGTTTQERAESVRSLILDTSTKTFGTTENERLLHRVLVRGYLDPAPHHELAADELALSRSSYFRRLRQAADRIADYIAATESGTD